MSAPLLSSGSQATSSICESLASSMSSPVQTGFSIVSPKKIEMELEKSMPKNEVNIYETNLSDLDEDLKHKQLSKYLLKSEFNGMSSFGRDHGKKSGIELKSRDSFYKYDSICSLSTKDKTDSVVLLENIEQDSPFKFNTATSVKPKTTNQQQNYFSLMSKTAANSKTTKNTSTFLPIQNKEKQFDNEDINDSIQEDNTQGKLKFNIE